MKRTAPFSMRLDPELKDALQGLAEADHRSLTNYIENVLRQHVAAANRRSARSRK